MYDKKDEIDTLDKLSEKDLWCRDLDAFVAEWEDQLQQDAEIAKNIRNTNRRRSNKIGAGGKAGGRGRAKKDDEEFTVGPKKKAAAKPLKAGSTKGVTRVENKPHRGFMDMFSNKPNPKAVGRFDGGDDSGMSDDDFAALVAPEADGLKTNADTGTGRSKRAAAAAPKKWVVDDDEEDESEDDNLLGDIDNMVKGIGGSDNQDAVTANSRLSLFAMSTSNGDRPSSGTSLPKPKPKPGKVVDLSEDETNYEMLARSSPQKAPAKDEVDGFLSSDEEIIPIVSKKGAAQKAKASKEAPKPKKAPVAKKTAAAESKPTTVSPAAKAYAAKQNRLKEISKSIGYTEDDSEDEEMEDASPPPNPAARGKHANSKTTATNYVISDDSDEDIEMEDATPPKKATNGKASSRTTYISDDEEDSIAPPPKRGTKPKAAAKKLVVGDDDDESIAPPTKRGLKAKAAPKKSIVSDDEEEEEEDELDSPPPKPAARGGRGRPARAAAAAKPKKPVYTVDSDDEEEDDDIDDVDESAMVEDDESEDDFSE